MANESPPTNLISKFTQLFRESAEDEAGFKDAPVEHEAAPTELSFKQQLERKAHNDAIRVKELQQLRAIIRKNANAQSGVDSEMPSPSSHAPISRAVPVSRATPLVRPALPDPVGATPADLSQWWGAPVTPPSPPSKQADETPSLDDDLDLDFVDMLSHQAAPDISPSPVPKDAAPEPEPDPVEACLQQAAERYAQGDFNAADRLLTAKLQDDDLGDEAAELLIFSRFDVYRCSGQQARFDELALYYANRFGRSPGEWYCVPEITEQAKLSSPETQKVNQPNQTTGYWHCPAILDLPALVACADHNPPGATICQINWENLQEIDVAIAPSFSSQIQTWQKQTVELHWSGVDVLLGALEMRKNSGNAALDAPWWLIHLNLLCLLQQREAFEDLAMDYCMRFEYSAPEYKPLANKVVHVQAPKSPEAANPNPYALAELRGNILGSGNEALRHLEAASQTAQHITITCAQLGRVEDSAAQALLNWATQTQAGGCDIRFTHLPRLVFIRLNMLGMHKVAKLSTGAQ